jgi:hypothetical protein
MKVTTTVSQSATAQSAAEFKVKATAENVRVDRNGDVVPVGLKLTVRNPRCVSID